MAIKPALTADQWAGKGIAIDGEPGWHNTHGEESVPSGDRHAVAALCLYGQPFGLTREDVKTLRTFRRQMLATSEEWARVKDLADRIEALLPPEGS